MAKRWGCVRFAHFDTFNDDSLAIRLTNSQLACGSPELLHCERFLIESLTIVMNHGLMFIVAS
jgi:hypothetical protein